MQGKSLSHKCPMEQLRRNWLRGSQVELKKDFDNFEAIVGLIVRFEDRCSLLSKLAPGGCMESVRKLLSYDGAIRIDRSGIRTCSEASGWHGKYRDPGNYTYAVLLRSIGLSGTKCMWSNEQYAKVYNDETLGDILEAALGLAWRRRMGKELPMHVVDDADLQKFAVLLEDGVLYTEKVLRHTLALGIWNSSKDLAVMII